MGAIDRPAHRHFQAESHEFKKQPPSTGKKLVMVRNVKPLQAVVVVQRKLLYCGGQGQDTAW